MNTKEIKNGNKTYEAISPSNSMPNDRREEFLLMYRDKTAKYGPECFSGEWATEEKFLDWVSVRWQKIPKGCSLSRTRLRKPYDQENGYFIRPGYENMANTNFAAYHKIVKANCVKEWEDRDVFAADIREITGNVAQRSLGRKDENQPYGPDNILLLDNMFALNSSLIGSRHVDYAKFYRDEKRKRGDDAFSDMWSDIGSFLEWIDAHKNDIPDRVVFARLDENLPLSPSNFVLSPIKAKQVSSDQRTAIRRKMYKETEGFRVPEWDNKKNFAKWFEEEAAGRYVKKLLRYDNTMPYGPDNCFVVGKVSDFNNELKAACGTDLAMIYSNVKCNHNGNVSDEWATTYDFLAWAKNHLDKIPPRASLCRYNPEEKFSPENCFFSNVGQIRKTKDLACSEEKVVISNTLKEIKKKYGIKFSSRYSSLKLRGRIDPEIWPLEDYYKYICQLYREGKIYPEMHMHRIDKTKPLSMDNHYFSYRQEGVSMHGLCFTTLYNQYMNLVNYQKERLEKGISIDEFLEKVSAEDYSVNSVVAVVAKENVSLDDVIFYRDNNARVEDVIKIGAAYRDFVAGRPNTFGSLTGFMKWSVKAGYAPYKDFRQVKEGVCSPETCVWDIFTKEGAEAHYKQIKAMSERARGVDYMYRKRANLKAMYGISEEWNDLDAFVSWCSENGFEKGDSIVRIDKTRPSGPDNCYVKKKAA